MATDSSSGTRGDIATTGFDVMACLLIALLASGAGLILHLSGRRTRRGSEARHR